MSEKEKIEKAKKEKIILHGNTRLSRTPWKSDKQEDKIRKEVENREAMEAGEEMFMSGSNLEIFTSKAKLVLTERRSADQKLRQLTGLN